MRNRGVRRPGRSVLICAAMLVGGSLSVLWGTLDTIALGHETPSTGLRIGIGLFSALFGGILMLNFIRGMRAIAALRRGEGVIARWTVPPASFDRFREVDRTLGDNDYRVPRKTPPEGVEVVFSEDAVLIGDTFFGLATTGTSRFTGVRVRETNPPSIAFGTTLTSVIRTNRIQFIQTHGALRVPLSRSAQAEAARVLRHYSDVIARRKIVKPFLWRSRVRGGLWVAAICIPMAGLGFALAERNDELHFVPLILAVTGVIVALGGLIVAGIAWSFRNQQFRR